MTEKINTQQSNTKQRKIAYPVTLSAKFACGKKRKTVLAVVRILTMSRRQ